MILCDREIQQAIAEKRIIVDPNPGAAFMTSTSMDLRLAPLLHRWNFPANYESMGIRFRPGHRDFVYGQIEAAHTEAVSLLERPYDLPPAQKAPANFILGYTLEKIYIPITSRICARVEGKSSLGRMGLGVHVTAPTIHAGFGNNQQNLGAPIRLEIWNCGPITIELANEMRICQLILEEVREVPAEGYRGQFNAQGLRPPQ